MSVERKKERKIGVSFKTHHTPIRRKERKKERKILGIFLCRKKDQKEIFLSMMSFERKKERKKENWGI